MDGQIQVVPVEDQIVRNVTYVSYMMYVTLCTFDGGPLHVQN